MNNTQKSQVDPQVFLLDWLKAANQFWAGPKKPEGSSPHLSDSEQKKNERVSTEALYSIIKTWGTISTAMSEPSAFDALYRGMAILPDIVSNVIQSGLKGYLKIQTQFMEKMSSIGKSSEAYSFDNLDQEPLKAWSDIYQKELHKYFNIPQLGLTRFYQERLNQALDKFNIFSTSLLEFMNLIFLPFEKSFEVIQQQIEERTKEGTLPEDPQDLYRMWIKILEGHFMTLFKSPEYTKALASTLNSLEEFISSRNSIVQDALQSLPIPTSKDMDDLYQELYVLKKKVKDLEKSRTKK
jgi:class III poly(R)-hydroxyalkanoic acid synthase PhaE subunit